MNDLVKTKIINYIKEENFIVSNHARIRMIDNKVTTDQLKSLLLEDEVIEDYPDDFPCHSSLILSILISTPYHIVVGVCQDHIRIVTLYIPSSDLWMDFKERIGDKNKTKLL